MPKFYYEEATLREYASYAEEEAPAFDVEEQIAKYNREPDGRLSAYESAQCPIDEEKLRDRSRLALAELRQSNVKQLTVDYNGGGDEGFTYFRTAKAVDGEKTLEQLSDNFKDGPLGEAIQAQPNPRYHYSGPPVERTRQEWAFYRLEFLLNELASQLLGRGFGTGDYSLQGAFVADLEANTLTDIAPGDG